MSMLELQELRVTPLVTTPLDYLIVPNFVKPEAVDRIWADFPKIDKGGSFPISSLNYGPAFAELVDELLGPEMREVFAEKFDIDLDDRPATLTVRGRTRTKDGKIHTDSKTKLITVLLYLNHGSWEPEGGRLRLLGCGDDIEDVIEEIRPDEGMLVAFRCSEDAWHGHKPFDGERRSIQLNWVVDEAAAKRSDRRHSLSALVKRLVPFG